MSENGKKVGESRKFSNEEITQALREGYAVIAVAADILSRKNPKSKITREGLRKRIANSPVLTAVLEDEKERVKDMAEYKLIKHWMGGDLKALQTFLKTQCKDRGYTERDELTGAEGAPLVPEAMPVINVSFVKSKDGRPADD